MCILKKTRFSGEILPFSSNLFQSDTSKCTWKPWMEPHLMNEISEQIEPQLITSQDFCLSSTGYNGPFIHYNFFLSSFFTIPVVCLVSFHHHVYISFLPSSLPSTLLFFLRLPLPPSYIPLFLLWETDVRLMTARQLISFDICSAQTHTHEAKHTGVLKRLFIRS